MCMLVGHDLLDFFVFSLVTAKCEKQVKNRPFFKRAPFWNLLIFKKREKEGEERERARERERELHVLEENDLNYTKENAISYMTISFSLKQG